MKYTVVLRRSEEGFSVSCPDLPGCWSQGATEEEALANIRDAIREYIAARDAVVREEETREVEAVRALEKAGFRIVREGKHTVMSAGLRIITAPRRNHVNAYTMAGIVLDAGLTLDDFKKLLR
jgi:predicted RNase H-like HicB family nuclease